MGVASDLLRLQELDLEIMRNTKLANELPQKDRIARLRRAIKVTQSELMHTKGLRKDLEMEIEENSLAKIAASDEVDAAQKRAEEGAQGYREIQDLEAKLSMLAKRLEKLDFDRANLDAQLEGMLEEERRKETLIQRATAEEEALLEEYKAALDGHAKAIERAKQDRTALVEDIPSDLLKRYEAASKRFAGLAVESISQGNKPSICRVALQPSQLPLLKGEDGICECPYCKRILIIG
ncbi:MAG: hypothetical protein IJH87_06165 [Atopobiaceae bacterium]|nr:hypothetical protein [Atopobiaceae bacterium]